MLPFFFCRDYLISLSLYLPTCMFQDAPINNRNFQILRAEQIPVWGSREGRGGKEKKNSRKIPPRELGASVAEKKNK